MRVSEQHCGDQGQQYDEELHDEKDGNELMKCIHYILPYSGPLTPYLSPSLGRGSQIPYPTPTFPSGLLFRT